MKILVALLVVASSASAAIVPLPDGYTIESTHGATSEPGTLSGYPVAYVNGSGPFLLVLTNGTHDIVESGLNPPDLQPTFVALHATIAQITTNLTLALDELAKIQALAIQEGDAASQQHDNVSLALQEAQGAVSALDARFDALDANGATQAGILADIKQAATQAANSAAQASDHAAAARLAASESAGAPLWAWISAFGFLVALAYIAWDKFSGRSRDPVLDL